MAVPLIPRAHLFGNPSRVSAEISPDGRQVSFLAPLEGVLNVWVGPAEDLEAARPVTRDRLRGIRFHAWLADARHVLWIQDEGGDENWRIYAVDTETGEQRDLTALEGVQARFIQGSWERRREVLIGLNDRDPQYHDVYLLDVPSGTRTLVEQNDRFAYYVADHDLTLRLAAEQTAEGGYALFRRVGETWEPLLEVDREDALTTGPLFVDRGDVAWFKDSRGRDTAALVGIHLETGEAEVLGESAKADVESVLVHPTERRVQAWSVNHERVSWTVRDPEVAESFAHLSTVERGDFAVVSRTRDDGTWIVAYTRDDGPATWVRYHRASRQADRLFTSRPELEGAPLVRMHPRVLRSRDGLDLVSYLTLPQEAGETGHPEHPLPMVLVVHGGPWARDTFGFQPIHQWLANRGYAVLSVNFRGSTGFGKDFLNAADHEWGRKMHEDLLDAVEWAIDEGIARRDAVSILGGSYGGYATLVGLAFTPEVFACGVDIVGPSNLETLLATIPPYWKPLFETFARRVGDPRTEEGRALLQERSPLHRVDAIARPLLIGQGANDPRVKQAESDQIVQAMQAKGIDVTYVRFPDEGHGFARPENNLAFYAVTEAFLSEVLGGRFEPLGEELAGSSIEVPAGAEHIPGLSEALES